MSVDVAGPFSMASDYVAAALDEVVVTVRCGLHPWEKFQERPNRLSVSVKVYCPLPTRRAAEMAIADYDPVRKYLLGLQDCDHIDLLESIADGITDTCFADPKVAACFIRLRKLDIFNETAGAGIDVFRTREKWGSA